MYYVHHPGPTKQPNVPLRKVLIKNKKKPLKFKKHKGSQMQRSTDAMPHISHKKNIKIRLSNGSLSSHRLVTTLRQRNFNSNFARNVRQPTENENRSINGAKMASKTIFPIETPNLSPFLLYCDSSVAKEQEKKSFTTFTPHKFQPKNDPRGRRN